MPAGRPPFEITEQVLKKVETLAAQGLNYKQIGHVLGISHETFIKKRQEFSELTDAIERGRSKGVATITNALFEKAKSGDVNAAKYFLNNRDNNNWADRTENINRNIDETPEKPISEIDDEDELEAIANGTNITPISSGS